MSELKKTNRMYLNVYVYMSISEKVYETQGGSTHGEYIAVKSIKLLREFNFRKNGLL